MDEGCLEALAVGRDGESKRGNVKNLTEHHREQITSALVSFSTYLLLQISWSVKSTNSAA